MSYSVGERYWVPHEEHAWLAGTLKDFKNQVLEFHTDKGVIKLRVLDLKQKLEPCGGHIDDFVENLVDLDELSEGAILHHIRNRYNRKHIYTHVGSILVAVNPFEHLEIYGDRDIRRAQETTHPYPHVFVTAATAYAQLQENRRNQSVLISGESGAGKTETTKKVLTYLANVAPDSKPKSPGEPGVETKILQSNPLLEALGNAKTLRNNNSSRFGKWMKVGFDAHYRIQGCEIVNYLLEKSRVISQSSSERNYHIFYQLLSGADAVTRERLHLRAPSEYNYLNQSGCVSIEQVDDAQEFKDTLQAMVTLQFSSNTIENVCKILAGTLLLGNIDFELPPGGSEYATMATAAPSVAALRQCEELLGVSPELFTFALVEKRVQMGRGSVVSIKLTPAQAVDNRDTLAKTIYSNLFDYVIGRVNATLRTDESAFSIGILDIFGFEVFQTNSFEQLCINYANEKLQSHFNEVIFNFEKLMYEEESVPLESIVFEDNNDCVGLIENKPYGLLTLLEEECSLGNASDQSYISKIDKTFGVNKPHSNRYFVKNKTNPDCFTVLHFAGGVEYTVTGFLDKNRDNLSATLKEVMELAQVPLLVELFADKPVELAAAGTSSKKSGGSGGSSKTTLGIQFRNQLVSLVTSLRQTEPHFIRCVKPNHLKKPAVLHGQLALCQMRYAGLFEAIRIRKSGFAYRVTYQTFASTYQILVPHLMKRRERKEIDDYSACALILEEVSRAGKLPRQAWVVGKKSKVFLKNAADRLVLERERNARVIVYVVKLQQAAKSFIVYMRSQRERLALRKQMLRQQEQARAELAAAVRIQKIVRGRQVRAMVQSMANLLELRRVLAKREVHRIRDVLARIDEDFLVLTRKQDKLRGGQAQTQSPRPGSGREKELLVWRMFEQEIKVAKVMLRLLEIQETFVLDLRAAVDKQNVIDLNRLLLKAERLEMAQHPLVAEARDSLLTLHKKRKIMKSLLGFLSNEDEYSDHIVDVIAEAKQYDVDTDFVSKVQMICNNAGPRLKTRNRLRHAVETCDGFAIEQSVLEVQEIRALHSQFAEAELRAARAMLRLLYFDELIGGGGAGGRDGEATRGEGTGGGETKGDEERPPMLIWGEPARYKAPSSRALTPQLLEICTAVTEAAFPTIRKMHKLKLIETAGSLERVYEVIRLFKWSKLLCTWKYPEITGAVGAATASAADSASPTRPSRTAAMADVRALNENRDSSECLDGVDGLLHSPGAGATLSPATPKLSFQPVGGRGVVGRATPSTQTGSHAPAMSIYNRMNSTVDNGDGEEGGAEEFYGLQFAEARGNAFIIRSLHQDFDAYINQDGKSATMEAALSTVELSQSMQHTLQNLDLINDIDKRIVLPNGGEFKKNTRRHQTLVGPGDTLSSAAALTMTSSSRKLPMGASTGSSSLKATAAKAFSGMTTAPREKTVRKAPMPQMNLRRVEHLHDGDVEKQLHISRLKKQEELAKRDRELTKQRRGYGPN